MVFCLHATPCPSPCHDPAQSSLRGSPHQLETEIVTIHAFLPELFALSRRPRITQTRHGVDKGLPSCTSHGSHSRWNCNITELLTALVSLVRYTRSNLEQHGASVPSMPHAFLRSCRNLSHWTDKHPSTSAQKNVPVIAIPWRRLRFSQHLLLTPSYDFMYWFFLPHASQALVDLPTRLIQENLNLLHSPLAHAAP